MGCFKNPNYVREFVYRTKYNYLVNLSLFGKDPVEYKRKVDELKKKMLEEKYAIEDYFHVTALLNSMMGLLVFPETVFYNYITDDCRQWQEVFPKLHKCITNDKRYINTYRDDNYNSPREVIRHLKNAFSHDRVMLFPTNNKSEKEISGVLFQDYKCINNSRINGKLKAFGDIRELLDQDDIDSISLFSVEIPIEMFEGVVMEISDYILGLTN